MSSTKALILKLERLNDTLDTLQQEWKRRSAKRKQLGKALAIEANAANQFQLEQQIQTEDTHLNALDQKIQQIEAEIHQVTQELAQQVEDVDVAIALHQKQSSETEHTTENMPSSDNEDIDGMEQKKVDLRDLRGSQGAIVNPVAGTTINQQFGNTTSINTGGGDYAGGNLSK